MVDEHTMHEQPDAAHATPAAMYTRTGDAGETTFGHRSRARKADPRVVAAGECEEVGALLGTAITLAAELPVEVVRVLTRVQNDLIDVGADIGTPLDAPGGDDARVRVDEAYIARLERACDHFSTDLAPLDGFVLPGGTTTAAALHHARSVVRRAERTTHAALQRDRMNPLTGTYLNRLGSLLLILAREANIEHGDALWQPGLSTHLGGAELWEPIPEPGEG